MLALAAALSVTAGSLTIAGASGVKTLEYLEKKRQAAEITKEIFFGEDAYILSDTYADSRIPQYVLTALRRWSADVESSAPAFERALAVLAESPDPKADNVLEAMLRHSVLLPLSDEAETTLLKTLILRDNEQVWRFMGHLMEQTADNPRMVKRLQRMVALAVSSDSKTAFENSFHFLKSRNDEPGHGGRAIFGALTTRRAVCL